MHIRILEIFLLLHLTLLLYTLFTSNIHKDSSEVNEFLFYRNSGVSPVVQNDVAALLIQNNGQELPTAKQV